MDYLVKLDDGKVYGFNVHRGQFKSVLGIFEVDPKPGKMFQLKSVNSENVAFQINHQFNNGGRDRMLELNNNLTGTSTIIHNYAQGKFPILSNVNDQRISTLIDVIDNVEAKTPFREHGKDLIFVERNPRYLNLILSEIFPQIGIDKCQKRDVANPPTLPHHHHKRMAPIVEYFGCEQNQSGIISVVARTKSPDSIVEKISRYNGADGKIRHDTNSRQLFVSDTYALTTINENVEECYQTAEKIASLPFLRPVKEKNYFLNPKDSGYRAIHQYFTWDNGIEQLNGLGIEVHHATKEGYNKNIFGDSDYSGRSHYAHGLRKLAKTHSLEGYQVIVVDHLADYDKLVDTRLMHQRIVFPKEVRLHPKVDELSYHLLEQISN